MSLCVS